LKRRVSVSTTVMDDSRTPPASESGLEDGTERQNERAVSVKDVFNIRKYVPRLLLRKCLILRYSLPRGVSGRLELEEHENAIRRRVLSIESFDSQIYLLNYCWLCRVSCALP
jgi:hypothetical protein